MSFVEIPKVDSLLKQLTDEQVLTMLKKTMDELRDPDVRRDLNRFVELTARGAACAREADRRGGRLKEIAKEYLWENEERGEKQ